MKLVIFEVFELEDWKPVADHLLMTAAEKPLDRAESEGYSRDQDHMMERINRDIAAGRQAEMTEYSAVAIRRTGERNRPGNATVISMVLTMEPNSIHLSVVGVEVSHVENVPGKMVRLSDDLATEVAENILIHFEEREEGVIPEVRHFYYHVED